MEQYVVIVKTEYSNGEFCDQSQNFLEFVKGA